MDQFARMLKDPGAFLQFWQVPTVIPEGMTVNMLCVLAVVMVFCIAWVAMRSRGAVYKLATLVLVVLTVPVFAVAVTEQLSYPKTLSLTWLDSKDAQGLRVYQAIDKAPKWIYIVVDMDGPRLFQVPWSQTLEGSLQKAVQDLKEQTQKGSGGDLRLHMEPSLDNREPKFYADPWPEPPSKTETEPEAPAVQPMIPQVSA